VSRIVLDSSILLAILNGEPGTEIFVKQPALLASATMSTVNVAEAFGKLVALKINPDKAWEKEAWQAVSATIPDHVAFDTEQAQITVQLLSLTRSHGLSLGDRACLALGIALKAPVYTADRAWKKLDVGVSIHVIR
jgi:ribonuclease VapC